MNTNEAQQLMDDYNFEHKLRIELQEKLEIAKEYLLIFKNIGCALCHREIRAKEILERLE